MKIIDQTKNTIRKQKGKVKKSGVPGSSKITEFRLVSKIDIEPNPPDLIDEVNLDFTSFLHQELETLMQPENYGINVCIL